MESIRIEVEIEDRHESKVVVVEENSLNAILEAVRKLAALDDVHVFERDKDEPIGAEVEKKKVLTLVAHRCKKVLVKVRFEHRTEEHEFSPSATIFRVLHWAIGKKAFNLDDTARAKANLMLPGSENPLPKDDVIGSFVRHGNCELILELTLRDFTNG